MEVKRCNVMVDAIEIKTKIAKTIIEQGGGYILAVKENQGHLYEDIHDLFAANLQFNYEGIQTLVMILSERRIGDESEVQGGNFISSLM
jgi:predicted transposase YbfD/YdcC